jgi:NAD(P)-dependent dehydrogenase (short-subunit alcohol dehydrogenase family)
MAGNTGDMNFDRKVVMITGASSGTGAACVRELACRNATIAMIDCKPERQESEGGVLAETRAKGMPVHYFQADIRSRPLVKQVAPIAARLGGIDVRVSSAGIQHYGTVIDINEEEWNELLDINLKGAFSMSKYAIPDIVRRGGGAIVITGSVQSASAEPNSDHYVSSKQGRTYPRSRVGLRQAEHSWKLGATWCDRHAHVAVGRPH